SPDAALGLMFHRAANERVVNVGRARKNCTAVRPRHSTSDSKEGCHMALEPPLLVGADVNRSGRTWSSVASRVLLLAYAAIVTVLMVYAIAKGPQRRAAL